MEITDRRVYNALRVYRLQLITYRMDKKNLDQKIEKKDRSGACGRSAARKGMIDRYT